MCLKDKFGQIGPKIKASFNLHESLHTRKFKVSKCKYNMIKIISNSNSNFQKFF